MVSINTSDDLIQVIRENPDFRATVRRELLTEELLEMPGRLQALTTTVEGLSTTVESLSATVESLSATVEGLSATVESLSATVEGILRSLGELSATVENLSATTEGHSTAIGVLTDNVAELRGDVLESKLTNRIPPLIARQFDVRRVYPIWSDGFLPTNTRIEEFEKTLEEATDEGKVSDDDETRLRVTDLIVRTQRKSDRSTLWFAVEASGSIHDDDITRAKHSADILKKIFGQDAIPLVYGYRIPGRYRELAEELQVAVLLEMDSQ